MSFLNLGYVFYIILFFSLFSYFSLKKTNRFFIWIYNHWFYQRSKINIFANYIFLISILLLLISLMDLRGRPENVETDIGPDKTVILIDVSTSMMVEDVRPSRFKKAILFARHFVKHAIGKEVAVILFSDSQKKLVPFTTDIDLVATRLNSLEDFKIQGGGTSISKALLSTINYLRDSKGNASGSIVLITDAEENEAKVDFDFPKDVSLAVVGVGTADGGRIPIKGVNDILIGYKRFGNEYIVSKLSEKGIKSIGEGISEFNYWLLQSYSLPTEQILKFLSKSRDTVKQKKKAVIREVKAHLLLIPACILFILSIIFKNINPVFLPLFIMFFLIPKGFAEEKEKKLTPEQLEALEKIEEIKYKISDGDYHFSEKLKLAFNYLKLGEAEKSIILYDEVTSRKDIKLAVGTYINYATSKAMNKKIDDAIRDYYSIYKSIEKVESEDAEKLREIIRKNTLTLIIQQEQQSGKGKSEDSQENESDSQEEGDESQESDGDQKKDKGKNGKEDKKDKEQGDKAFEMDNEDKKEEQGEGKDKEKKEDQKNGNEQKNKDKKETKGEGKEQKKEKLDARLKQLLDEDKKTQGDLLNPKIKGESATGKEW